MTTVTVSPKFQVLIPKEIRKTLGIVGGQKVGIISYKSRIILIPLKPMPQLKGFLKAISTRLLRDNDPA